MIPPNLIVIHPDTGESFRLTDESFARWWQATVLPEDSQEYVHLYRGSIEEARYVCALDYITNVQGESGADTVMKAYFLAKNLPIDLKDTNARVNAQYLSTSDSVAYLLNAVRKRTRRVAEERIANLTTTKIEELYERSHALDGLERLNTERTALETSIKFLGNQARERGQEIDRRTKKATKDAMEKSMNADYGDKRLPSLAEARLHLAMLVDGHGADAISKLVDELAPLGIESDESRP